jgi:hypothetical protein
MPADDYLIWSNEHRGWWRPGSMGYHPGLKRAGRYSREQALEICQNALMTGAHLGMISEIPVRFADIESMLHGAMAPVAVLDGPKIDPEDDGL